MAELGLKKKEIDAIDFAFDVYDFKGDGKVDAFYAGDLIRACNLNPTLKTIAEIGGTTEKGQKMITKAEVFPMYKACKDSKDQGGFHDFVEILKLYDKNEDNTMLSHELFRLLTNLGEKLTKEEAKSLMKELCEPADDEGFMPFIRKYKTLHSVRDKTQPCLAFSSTSLTYFKSEQYFIKCKQLLFQPSWRGCALLRSKLQTSQVQHCNYHHHRESRHESSASHQYTDWSPPT